ncbi:GDP-mannose 4,6-dehydratase [Ferruginibacter albus]|uniref:GDP-mannose 4,6-dehydratase n=1 Tax=Ferruginibacter albus TaxID=2875540 RepID=UPI001CC62BD1|nr:GDP-mannose 4,6-dehydratase [Ferruginibacter albus]UAY53118.1 GDP-mannose 4,6-dehydratase [Ferruginibacter albus]
MKKYLITGYSGFVSHHFLNYLESLQQPCNILGVDINEAAFDLGSYKYVQGSFKNVNLLNREEVDVLIHDYKPDYILHLASYSSVASSWKNPVTSFVNNTNIFLNLVEQVRLLGLACRILSVGSSEEYGKVDVSTLPLHEELPTNPVSPYAVARVSQEMLSQIYAKSYGLDIVLTRSFNHIGPGQKEMFAISSFAKKMIGIKHSSSGEKTMTVGDIEIVRDFVDVRDVVKAYYLLLQKGEKGEIYNICSGKGITLKEVLQTMKNILQIEVNIQIDKELIRPADNPVIIGSNKKIKDKIGWQPSISLETSLKDLLNYWDNNQ